MRATVPTGRIRNRYDPFPEGTYRGRIDETEVRDPNDDGEWLLVEVSVEDIEPVDETDDPGRDSFSDDLTVKTDGLHIADIEDFTQDDLYEGRTFGLVRAAGLLAGLGEAVGATEIDDEEMEQSVDIEAILEALTSGEFDSEVVGFEVGHYERDDGLDDQFVAFGVLE